MGQKLVFKVSNIEPNPTSRIFIRNTVFGTISVRLRDGLLVADTQKVADTWVL